MNSARLCLRDGEDPGMLDQMAMELRMALATAFAGTSVEEREKGERTAIEMLTALKRVTR